MISLSYKNSHEAAAAVYGRIKTERNPYKMKPYNYNDLYHSLWWILPPKAKGGETAFQHGKFCFFEDEHDGKPVLFCGIHVERGLTNTYGDSKKLEMDDNWAWHYFVRKIKDDTLGSDIEKLVQVADSMVIKIDGHFHRSGKGYDQLRYILGNGKLEDGKREGKDSVFLQELEKKDVFSVLKALEALECVETESYRPITWIDCFIGVYAAFNENQNGIEKLLEALECLDRYVIEP